MFLAVFTLFASTSFALTDYSELTALLARHPESKVEDVLNAIDPETSENHIFLYHPGGLLTGSPKFPAVGMSTPLQGTAAVAEQKNLMALIYQTELNQGKAQEIEVIEWQAAQNSIQLHRITFSPVTKMFQRIENNPPRCLTCHGFSNDGNRNRPIWDSYSKNAYSNSWGSFPDVMGGGLSFEPRIFENLKTLGPRLPRSANLGVGTLDTTPGFASTLYAMNWVNFANDVEQKLINLSEEQKQNLKSDFVDLILFQNEPTLFQNDNNFQRFLVEVTTRRKTYLRDKFTRSIALEGLFANSVEKESVRSINNSNAFASADHDAYFYGNTDDLTLARIFYVLKKNGVQMSTASMSLSTETYTTRSNGSDEHISYFEKRIKNFVLGL